VLWRMVNMHRNQDKNVMYK